MADNKETGQLLRMIAQRVPLTRAVVTGRDRISALSSFFRSLSGVTRHDGCQFTLGETLNVWRTAASGGDRDAQRRLDKVKAYGTLSKSPTSNPMVTILECSDGLVVVDGNHTAIAALTAGIDLRDDAVLTLPVYILTLPVSTKSIG